ncbi:MAG: RNA-protein complex protein Nop10 [Halobacteria archaeon]|nr:RNA-protein complex protein Nop10 [Halobacteria archaeon]
MKTIIRACFSESHPETVYTLRDKCPECGKVTRNTSPPRFSPDDPYGKYRRKTKYGGN